MAKKPTKGDIKDARQIGKELSDVLTATFHTMNPRAYKRVSYSTKATNDKIVVRLSLIGKTHHTEKNNEELTVVKLTFASNGSVTINAWDKTELETQVVKNQLAVKAKSHEGRSFNLFLDDPHRTAVFVFDKVIAAFLHPPSTVAWYL